MSALKPGSTIGIFGSGQLGRMLAMAAAELGLKTHVFSDLTGPACDIAVENTIAPYTDLTAIERFASSVDVITFEFENVPLEAVGVAANHARLSPDRKALEVAQDRFIEKSFVSGLGIPVAPFANIETDCDLEAAKKTTGFPAFLKTRRLGYDGKGQAQVSTLEELRQAYIDLGAPTAILEGHMPFEREVSVLAVRGSDGAIAFYDLPHNTHKNGILDTSRVPSDLPDDMTSSAHAIAHAITEALNYVGLLAVELFVMPEGAPDRLAVNEIAPRVHNSGHWTQDACRVSQFENHIRAIAGWPLGATDRHSDALMTNLIGPDVGHWARFAAQPGACVHLYGKAQARPGRKMGHITEIIPKTAQNRAKT